MEDKSIIDKRESLSNRLCQIINNKENMDSGLLVSKPSSNLIQLADWVKCNLFKDKETKLVLFDASMQLDGAFYCFCDENKYEMTNILTEAISVLSYAEKDFDPFILHGLVSIKISDDFKIVKSSLLYNQTNGTDNVSSFIIIDEKDYAKYIELKFNFIKWLRQKEGTVVKVVGGDDYLQDISYNWNDLFLGEKKEIKDDLKKYIDVFFDSKKYYRDNNIPWHMSILLECPSGCGKTSLINTLMSEYDLEPITVNYFNTDDSVIYSLFKSTEDKHKSLIFIDNIDDYIDQQFITQEYLYNLIESYKNDNGNILVFTCSKLPDFFKDLTFGFDKFISVDSPDYKESLEKLFGQYLTQSNIKDLQKTCQTKELSYEYIYKLYRLFIKTELSKKDAKKKEFFASINQILTSVIKEDYKLNKSRSKKIGLLNKK